MSRSSITLLLTLLPSLTPAIETTELSLRHGPSNDNLVTVTRDTAGNLLMSDAFTSPTMLRTIASIPTDHGALAGLEDDDHLHYLNASRHSSVHTAVYNGALPVSGEVNNNETLGEHLADNTIHPDISENVSLTGVWQFHGGLTAKSGALRLGTSQYTSAPAIRFQDDPEDAELSYDTDENTMLLNRPLSLEVLHIDTTLDGRDALGNPSAELVGFTVIAGIVSSDLVSSTQNESISESWNFLDGIHAASITFNELPKQYIIAENSGSSTISAGDVVQLSGASPTRLLVEKSSGVVSDLTPFVGISLSEASTSQTLTLATSGVVPVSLSDNVLNGDRLIWDGSGAISFDNSSSNATFAIALEDSEAPGMVSAYIAWTTHNLP